MELKVKNPEIIDWLIEQSEGIGNCYDIVPFTDEEKEIIISTIKNTINLREYDEMKINRLLEIYNNLTKLDNLVKLYPLELWLISYIIINPSTFIHMVASNKSLDEFINSYSINIEDKYEDIFGFEFQNGRNLFLSFACKYRNIYFEKGKTEYSLIIQPTILATLYQIIKNIE